MGSTHAELPFAREPRVSIVILAWRNAARLRRCLASIQAHPGSAPTETVVVACESKSPTLSSELPNQYCALVVPPSVNPPASSVGALYPAGPLFSNPRSVIVHLLTST